MTNSSDDTSPIQSATFLWVVPNLVQFPAKSLNSPTIPFPDPALLDTNEWRNIWYGGWRLCLDRGGIAIASTQFTRTDTPFGRDARFESFWIEFDGTVVVNPTVTPIGKETLTAEEGCLSLPRARSKVTRFAKVKVSGWKYVLKNATVEYIGPFEVEADGLYARMAQHEYDHLCGKLYTAHISSAERSRVHGVARKHK